MNETFISFYLKANRIRIYIGALRGIGSPNRICFLLDDNLKKIIVAPYDRKDFRSHSVPRKAYSQSRGVEVSSIKLCQIISGAKRWDSNYSYCVPGKVVIPQKIAVFDLDTAFAIKPALKTPTQEAALP